MATQQATQLITLKANADLSTKQYYFVKMTAARTVDIASATTDVIIGILQNKPTAAGQEAVVAIGGTSKLVAGAAISAGAVVSTTAASKGQTAVATQTIAAVAIDAAAADLDIIEVLLIKAGIKA